MRRALPAIALFLGVVLTASMSAARAPIDTVDARSAAPHWRIDLDTATQAELELLPRIGPTLAERIIIERTMHGRFTSMDDLAQRVRGVGPRTTARLAPFVRSLDREHGSLH